MTEEEIPVTVTLSLLDLEERPWAAYASCRAEDPDLFFPGPDGDPQEALRICSGCPVKGECLEWALDTRVHYGIWGGMTERQRRRVLRRSA
jgi:WhiB family redox-sensing transcriptional regulator